MNSVPFIGIDRHRLGIDGVGVTTLAAFHGCPLRCKYCLNHRCLEAPDNLPRYTPVQNRRHEVLPGITGWAQVHGRNALDWETKFRYDVDYVDSRSLWLDAKILLMTVREVFGRRGISHEGEATMGEFVV